VVKAGEKGPVIRDQVKDVNGREEKVGLVVDVAPGEKKHPAVPFDGRCGDPFVFLVGSQKGGGDPLEGLRIRGGDKRPWVHPLFMQKPPEQLIGTQGI
jgi:hypothetical protein